jgi:hypothetical protein
LLNQAANQALHHCPKIADACLASSRLSTMFQDAIEHPDLIPNSAMPC